MVRWHATNPCIRYIDPAGSRQQLMNPSGVGSSVVTRGADTSHIQVLKYPCNKQAEAVISFTSPCLRREQMALANKCSATPGSGPPAAPALKPGPGCDSPAAPAAKPPGAPGSDSPAAPGADPPAARPDKPPAGRDANAITPCLLTWENFLHHESGGVCFDISI